MTQWALTHLDGGHPSDFLAAVGIASLVAGSTIAFPEGTIPVLASELDESSIADQLVEGIEHLTRAELSPLPDHIRTTTPAWSVLAPLCWDSWHNPTLDDLLRTFDIGVAKARNNLLDPQVEAATLVLVTGKSYVRKSIDELWPAPERKVDRESQLEAMREALHLAATDLLEGRRPASAPDAMALRFTASETSPRLRAGSEASVITPLVEALAFAGATRLLPRQQGITSDDPPKAIRGLRWALNLVPLTARALVDIHEQDAAPAAWPRFTARTQIIGGGTKAQQFVDVRPLEES